MGSGYLMGSARPWAARLASMALLGAFIGVVQGQMQTLTTASRVSMPSQVHAITDPQQGGLVLGTMTVPQGWKVASDVRWNYGDVSLPVRGRIRAESPDGLMWVEFFPYEVFYWLEPVRATVPYGGRSLGMIHAPGIGSRAAIEQYVVRAYRGNEAGLRVADSRSVDPARLVAAFHGQPTAGEAWVYRLNYRLRDQPVEEDIYGLLGAGNRIPYSGGQGTWYESHRPLMFAHGLGAPQGQLAGAYPLLSAIATSFIVDRPGPRIASVSSSICRHSSTR